MRGILNPRDLESYEYVSFEPTEALRINVGNGRTQRRETPKFMVKNFNEVTAFAWYNAYLEVDFQIDVLANGDDYAANAAIATAGSGFSLINRLTASFNGQLLYDSQDMNHAVSLRNLLEFSKPYGECVAESMLHFPETSRAASIDEFTTTRAPGMNQAGNAADAANPIIALTTRNVAYNAGFASRQKLLVGNATKNLILPLNRYGFFDFFREEIAPPGKVEINVEFEKDNDVLLRADGVDDGRYIVTKLVLWVPRVTFSAAKVGAISFMNPREWSYLSEQIENTTSRVTSTAAGG